MDLVNPPLPIESTLVGSPLEGMDTEVALPTPRIFKHELLQSFSFHLFAKRPIEPIVNTKALRRDIMRRCVPRPAPCLVCLSCLFLALLLCFFLCDVIC